MTSNPSTVTGDDFKAALGSWASGVTVVTTRNEGKVYGLTVSSFASLSFDPMLVLVCIQNNNRLGDLVKESKHFGVSILAQGQEPISNHFAMPGREPVDSYDDLGPSHSALTGSPLFDGCIATLDCELDESLLEGDHTILVGRVVAAGADPDKEPLMYYRRGYRKLVDQ